MKHLSNSFTGKNALWRYVVLLSAIFLSTNIIGGIPVIVAMVIKSFNDPAAITSFSANTSNFSLLGFDLNLILVMMLFPFLVGLLTFILLVKPLHSRTFRQTITGAPGFRWSRVFVSAFLWLILSVIYFVIYKAAEPSNFRLNNSSITLLWLAVISVVLIPFQALFEEVIFRGYLIQGFTSLSKKVGIGSPALFSVIVTSVLFGIMHSWNPEIREYGFFTMIPQYILFGLLFGLTTVYDGGIEIAAGAHAANNVFLSVFITNSSSALQTPALYEQINIRPWVEFWALVVTSAVFFAAMALIFKWKDFSGLLKPVKEEKASDRVDGSMVI